MPAAIPELALSEDEPATAKTHAEKAEMLTQRFFPNPPADLSDINDQDDDAHTREQCGHQQSTVDKLSIDKLTINNQPVINNPTKLAPPRGTHPS
jgi:hypothetical protein